MERMKICTGCGSEKLVEEFHTKQNVCRHCRNQRNRDRWMRHSTENISLYGTAHTPKELEKIKNHHKKRRAENIKLYGTAHTPTEMEKNRRRSANRRTKNIELYGATQTPTEAKTNGERRVTARVKRRTRALTLLGNKCQCCGESRPETLTFDHINGNDRGHNMTPAKVVDEILTMVFPASKYRVLCWNCNASSGLYNYCPHQGRPSKEEPASCIRERAKYNKQWRRRRKLESVAEYGGKCQVCGEENWEFLTVDHVNGNGTQHMRNLGTKGGTKFYGWLKRQGWPKDDYQLLCFNCNDSKGHVGKAAERSPML